MVVRLSYQHTRTYYITASPRMCMAPCGLRLPSFTPLSWRRPRPGWRPQRPPASRASWYRCPPRSPARPPSGPSRPPAQSMTVIKRLQCGHDDALRGSLPTTVIRLAACGPAHMKLLVQRRHTTQHCNYSSTIGSSRPSQQTHHRQQHLEGQGCVIAERTLMLTPQPRP